MKYIKNKIIDSSREILQIISLIACFIFPRVVNLSEIIRTILGGENPNFETAKYYYLMLSGNWTIGFLVALYVLFNFFRKSNKEIILNKGNIYHKHSYAWYWFCSKILGYEKCSLILVPIFMQFKLVLKDTFKEYPLDNSFFPEKECEVQIIKNIDNDKAIFEEVNLVIEDTYPIQDSQIPRNNVDLNVIKIKRISEKIGKRVYCRTFVDSIVEIIRELPEGTILNIFATTNPKHTYEIAKKGISLAERSNIKRVNIFQQKGNGKREFENKKNKVL
ncbi:hypothetical protein [Eubacterium callanderi]|uniref:hypothetical protein n=1 Tax=Eubacterium callanderi TaxID=53442 RepID=UPI001C118873|nr:hypothetical protein [Eubacterium callanderi]MBU5304832.1 hypothetical protein [Eubacterium callanderi]